MKKVNPACPAARLIIRAVVKLSIIGFLILFRSVDIVSQNQTYIDSLTQRLSNPIEDTIRVKILIELSDEHSNSNPETALNYANQGLVLSKRINFIKGINSCTRQIGIYYLNTSNYDSAIFYFNIALKIARINNDSIRLGPSYENVGTAYAYKGELDSAHYYTNLALVVYNKYQDFKGAGTAYQWSGNIYKLQGDMPKALNCYFLALDSWAKQPDTSSYGYAYANISSVYRTNQQFDEALRFGLKAVEFNKGMHNARGTGLSLYRLSLVYVAMDDYENARIHLESAITIFEEIKDKAFIGHCNNQIGFCNLTIGDFDQAIINFEKALQIGNEIGDAGLRYSATGYLGSLYRGMGEYITASEFLKEAINLAEQNDDVHSKLQFLGELMLVHARLNNLDSVDRYFFIYDSLKNAVYNAENQDAIAEMRTKYETDKKEKENINLKLTNSNQLNENLLLFKHNEIAQLKLETEQDQRTLAENLTRIQEDSINWLSEQRQVQEKLVTQEKSLRAAEGELSQNRIQNKNFIILTLAGLAIMVGAITFLINRVKKRKNEQHLKEVEEKALRAQLKPHFVFNALASIQKYVRDSPSVAESYLSKFSHFTQEVLVNSEKKKIPLSDELSMLAKYIELHSLRLKQPIEYIFNFDSNIDPDEIMVPPAIFQPLVENSINHNFAGKDGKGHISVHFNLEDSLLKSTLEDSCGGSSKQMEIQQDRDKNRKSFGLQIVKERLDLWSKGKGVKGYLELIPQSTGMRVNLGIPL